MMYDGQYKLNDRDVMKILRLIGQLKEAVAELLGHRYNPSPDDEPDIPDVAEMEFYELAEGILKNTN